jgi:hypothetical protein
MSSSTAFTTQAYRDAFDSAMSQAQSRTARQKFIADGAQSMAKAIGCSISLAISKIPSGMARAKRVSQFAAPTATGV